MGEEEQKRYAEGIEMAEGLEREEEKARREEKNKEREEKPPKGQVNFGYTEVEIPVTSVDTQINGNGVILTREASVERNRAFSI